MKQYDIAGKKVTFEELMLSLGDPAVKEILRELDDYDIAGAIRHESRELKNKFYAAMSRRAAARIQKIINEIERGIFIIFTSDTQDKIVDIIKKRNKWEAVIDRQQDKNETRSDEGILFEDDEPVTGESITEIFNNAVETGKLHWGGSLGGEITSSDCGIITNLLEIYKEKLSAITELSIPSSLVEYFEPVFKLGKLKEFQFTVYHSDPFDIPSCIRECHDLERLDFSAFFRKKPNVFKMESPIRNIPEWIGGFSSLKILDLHNTRITGLPDSIGNLSALEELDLSSSAIRELPASIAGCASLKTLNLNYTRIATLPGGLENIPNLKILAIGTPLREHGRIPAQYIEAGIICLPDVIIEERKSYNYDMFVESYYKLAQKMCRLLEKARREGLLSLEDELGSLDRFLTLGLRLVVDGTDADMVRDILRLNIKREHDHYKKLLKQQAAAGILSIQTGDSTESLLLNLANMEGIADNLIVKALAGHKDDADFDFVDFLATLDFPRAPKIRAELTFIKKAFAFSDKARREGLLALEDMCGKEIIEKFNNFQNIELLFLTENPDVFEAGILLAVDRYKPEYIDEMLGRVIERENDPVKKNFLNAQKAAALSICAGDNSRITALKLLGHFEDDVQSLAKEVLLKD
jgi:flagellar motor component MotA